MMIRKIILFVFLFSIFLNSYALQINLELSDNEVKIGDNFTLRIKIADNSTLNIGHVEIEGLDKFQILGNSKSSQTQIINGEVMSTLQHDFKLTTNYIGDLQIGPVIVESGNKRIESNIVNLKINPLHSEKETNKEINIDLIIAILFFILILSGIGFLFIKYLDEKNKIQKQLELQKKESQLNNDKLKIFIQKMNSYEFNNLTLDDLRDMILAYINVFYSLNLKSLTNKEIIHKLEINKLNDDLISNIKEILDKINTAKYSSKNIDLKDIFLRIKELINNN